MLSCFGSTSVSGLSDLFEIAMLYFGQIYTRVLFALLLNALQN